MKKIYVAILISFASLMAGATVHTVMVLPSSFSPSTVNAVCGDTVAWVLSSGSHTTTSTTIPSCATPWNAVINPNTPAFAIVIPNCIGTYNYICTPHSFTGVINVSCTVGMEDLAEGNTTTVSPNPSASGMFNLRFTDSNTLPERIYIVDTTGKKIMEETYVSAALSRTLNLQAYARGVYFLVLQNKNEKKVMKLVR